MTPVGPLRFKRTPEAVRRRLEMAAAGAWEAVVTAHVDHATRLVALTGSRLAFDEAVDRYLSEMDLRDPAASAVRSRVFIRLEERPVASAPGPGKADQGADREAGPLKRFRPDVLARGIARKVRENEAFEEWVRLAIARAEEAVLRVHIDSAVEFTRLLEGHLDLDEAVEDYIDLMRITGGRAQSVFQRAMALLADIHLPPLAAPPAAGPATDADTGSSAPS
jgi:hypothetical protein